MTNLNRHLIAALGALSACLAAPAALASRMAAELSGSVTAAEIGERINVNGVTYAVAQSAHVDQVLLELNVGDQVRLTLNGPPDDRNTKVLDVIVVQKKAAR